MKNNESMEFPRCIELSEQVRKFSSALIRNYGILPVDYNDETVSTPTSTTNLEFGVSDGKAIHKKALAKRRKKKKKKEKPPLALSDPKLVESLYGSVKIYTDNELAQLAEQAKQALAEASRLAGEPVIYCCAAIRRKSIHECFGECESWEHYKQINELAVS